MHKHFYLVVICAALCLSACSSQPQIASTSPTPKPEPTRNPNLKLVDAHIQEIIPTADGGAYIWTFDNHLWYVRQGVAVRVREADVMKLSSKLTQNTSNGIFALWVRERQKRKTLENEKYELEDEISELERRVNELEEKEGDDENGHDN